MNSNSQGYDADLFDAVEYGELDYIETLLTPSTTWPINVNAQDMKGETVLMLAAFHGREDVVAFLLRTGADPNVADLTGATALMRANAQGHVSISTMLKRAGAV